MPNFKSVQAFSGVPGAEEVQNTTWEVGLMPILPGIGISRKLPILFWIRSTTFECFLRNIGQSDVRWKYIAGLATRNLGETLMKNQGPSENAYLEKRSYEHARAALAI